VTAGTLTAVVVPVVTPGAVVVDADVVTGSVVLVVLVVVVVVVVVVSVEIVGGVAVVVPVVAGVVASWTVVDGGDASAKATPAHANDRTTTPDDIVMLIALRRSRSPLAT
jgi:hypothetical protein